MNIINYIFSTKWMPHKMCFVGDNFTMYLNLIGDIMFALSYFFIPLGLILWLRKQSEAILAPSYRILILGFGAFIFLCGISHIFDIIVLYYPLYRLSGYERIVGGIVSLLVALFLWQKKFKETKIVSYTSGDKISTEIQFPIVNK